MYLWLKAFHIIAVVSWMAGLLYLPRLFVYHADAADDGAAAKVFKVMEYRLARFIMTPAAVVSWGLGLVLMIETGFLPWVNDIWFAGKFVLILMLTAFHGLLLKHGREFHEGRNRHPPRYFRMINEIPTLLMIGIVILVVVKPF